MKFKVSHDGFIDLDEEGVWYPSTHPLALKWLEKGNTPEPEFTDKELEEQRVASIKSKAGEIITIKYSDIKQRNILMSQDINDIKTMNDYISDIRDISNKAELAGTDLEDINWSS